jgi:predicted HTH transcriptional regulator
MTSVELRKLTDLGEGQHLEFKKKADHPEKIVREMVAFANSGGGVLLIGVDDNGKISGLKFPEEEKFVMEAAIFQYAMPALSYKLDLIPIGQGLSVLKYEIPDGKEKPYFWLEKKENQLRSVYVRSKDQSLRASYEMFRYLVSAKQERPVTFGSQELLLLNELGRNGTISIRDFCDISGLGKKKVSVLFVSLCCSGVLEIIPGEHHDLFRLTSGFRS